MTVAAIEADNERSLDTIPSNKPSSRGQFLLPLLFAAMETCWLDAIFIGLANTDALGTTRLLFPLWLPFVLIGSFYILSSYQRWYTVGEERPVSGTGKHSAVSHLINSFLTLVATLFAIWVSVYASRTAISDPGWLLNIPAVVLQFNPDSFRLIGLIILAIIFCRQGTLLVRGKVNYVLISKLMQSGIFTFIILLVIQKFLEVTGHIFHDEMTILCLMVLYLCLSLATHALARVGVVRRHYSVGKKNDLIRQESVTLQSVILTSSILLAIALITGAILNATIIGDTGVLFYKPVSFIVPPLSSATLPASCGSSCTAPRSQQGTVHHVSQQPANTVISIILSALFIVLLLAIVAFTLVLVIKLIRWWRKRERPGHHSELHESLWSWPLFWQQFKGIVHALLKYVMASILHPTQGIEASLATDRQLTSIHNIYEIYRSFLNYAADRGYPRANYETPAEFSSRLAHCNPLIGPHFVIITSAFVTTRYGGVILKPEDVSATHNAWIAVQQNWQEGITAQE